MAFYDNWSKLLSRTGQGAMQKTKDMAEAARESSHLAELEKQLASCYEILGRRYFEEDAESERFPEEKGAILQTMREIEATKARIDALRGIVLCPACGREVGKDDLFCNGCGHPMREAEQSRPGECPRCHRPVAPDAQFCPTCGMEIPPAPAEPKRPEILICPECGQALLNDSLFCTRCGQKLPEELVAWFATETPGEEAESVTAASTIAEETSAETGETADEENRGESVAETVPSENGEHEE